MMNIFMMERHWGNFIFNDSANLEDFRTQLSQNEVSGYFSQFPQEETRNHLKNQLYYLSDRAGEKAFHEQDFLLRYFLSFLVFLFTFFILSYVIRDPIPLADELGVSFLASLGFNLWWKSKRKDSIGCDNIKLEMRSMIDRITFEESDFLMKLELYLQGLDRLTLDQLKDHKQWELPIFWESDSTICSSFIRGALGLWSGRQWRIEKKIFERGGVKKDLIRDSSLMALLLRLKKER